MQPITRYNTNLHRGPATSREFNQLQNDLHYDLTRLFNKASEHELQITDNMDILIRENFFLQSKLNQLTTLLEKIQADILYKEEGQNRQQLIKSMYTTQDVMNQNSAFAAEIDTLYGVATLQDSDRVSKVSFKTDTNEVVVPTSLNVTLMESNNTRPPKQDGSKDYYAVEDPRIKRAFDRNNNTFWVHTSSFPEESNVTEVYGLLHIKLPLNVLSNIYANTLTLHPYPEYSMTIADIWYKGYGETWYQLPNYPNYKDHLNVTRPLEIKDAGKLIFTFPKTEVTEVQIFFSQPYWFSNGGEREFVYGFQDIGIDHRIYNSASAEFVTEFSIEGTNKRFFTIDRPIAVPAPGSEQNIEDLVEHKLFYTKSLTDEFEFGSEILAPIQKIYVKTILRSQGDIIPVVKNLKLDYVFKDLDDL